MSMVEICTCRRWWRGRVSVVTSSSLSCASCNGLLCRRSFSTVRFCRVVLVLTGSPVGDTRVDDVCLPVGVVELQEVLLNDVLHPDKLAHELALALAVCLHVEVGPVGRARREVVFLERVGVALGLRAPLRVLRLDVHSVL